MNNRADKPGRPNLVDTLRRNIIRCPLSQTVALLVPDGRGKWRVAIITDSRHERPLLRMGHRPQLPKSVLLHADIVLQPEEPVRLPPYLPLRVHHAGDAVDAGVGKRHPLLDRDHPQVAAVVDAHLARQHPVRVVHARIDGAETGGGQGHNFLVRNRLGRRRYAGYRRLEILRDGRHAGLRHKLSRGLIRHGVSQCQKEGRRGGASYQGPPHHHRQPGATGA